MMIFDFCLRKIWSGKSHDHRDATVFEKPRFQIPPVWRAFSKSFVFMTDSV